VHNLILLCGHTTAFFTEVSGKSNWSMAGLPSTLQLSLTLAGASAKRATQTMRALSTNVSSSMTCRLAGSRGKLFPRRYVPSQCAPVTVGPAVSILQRVLPTRSTRILAEPNLYVPVDGELKDHIPLAVHRQVADLDTNTVRSGFSMILPVAQRRVGTLVSPWSMSGSTTGTPQ